MGLKVRNIRGYLTKSERGLGINSKNMYFKVSMCAHKGKASRNSFAHSFHMEVRETSRITEKERGKEEQKE